MSRKQKILVIIGPTASGKSDLAVRLAKKFEGEVISADSRQVYKGLDVATNKIATKEMSGVPHHMLDVWNPKKRVSVAEYKDKAQKIVGDIVKRRNLPILIGGTGFYIDAVVNGMSFPEVPPNEALREQLDRRSLGSLLHRLKKIDPERFKTIDQNNKRRIIRAIEIVETLGKVPKIKKTSLYDSLIIGLNLPKGDLKKNIEKSVKKRMRKGMLSEAEVLHKKGLSWKRMRELGLEYSILADYHQGKVEGKKELEDKITQEDLKYAKRQMTWFKRDKSIKWFHPEEVKRIEKVVKEFVT